MDWISTVNTALALVKKYRYALLAVVIGIILMSVPEGKTGNKTENMIPIEEKKIQLEESLAEILSEIDGVGNVRVLLTTSQGEETVYQMTRIFWENWDYLTQTHAALRKADPKEACNDIAGVPIHDGAARYYKEIGLL